jgi:hypothetical protein
MPMFNVMNIVLVSLLSNMSSESDKLFKGTESKFIPTRLGTAMTEVRKVKNNISGTHDEATKSVVKRKGRKGVRKDEMW